MAHDNNFCLTLWLGLCDRWSLLRDRDSERGAALTEYGLLLVLVGIAAFTILTLVGGEIWELFRDTGDATDSLQVPPPPD